MARLGRGKNTKVRATKMHHKTATKSARFANGVTSNRKDHNNRMSGVMGETTRARNTGTPTNRPVPGNGAGVMGMCPTGYYKCPTQTLLAGQCVQSRAECAGVGTRGGATGANDPTVPCVGLGMIMCPAGSANAGQCANSLSECGVGGTLSAGGNGVRTMSSYRRGGRTRRTRRRR